MLISNPNELISDTVIKLFFKCTKLKLILIQILSNQIACPIKARNLLENYFKVEDFSQF